MKLLILKVPLFTFLIILIILQLNPVFVKKELLRTYDIYMLDEKIDILFVGSSHVFTSIETNYLYRKTHRKSFLLSSPNQNISQNYYLIKEFLKYQKPKVIFLEIYSLKDYIGDDFANHAAYDGMKFSLNKVEAAYQTAFCDSAKNISKFVGLLMPLQKYHSRWNGEITKQDFTFFNDAYYSSGSEIIAPQKEYIPNEHNFIDNNLVNIKEVKHLPEKIENKLWEIVKMCKEANINLVLFSTPNISHQVFGAVEQVKTFNYLETVLKGSNIKFLNFNLLYTDIGIDYGDFSDPHHINGNGAKKVNDYLSTYIPSNYGEHFDEKIIDRPWYNYLNNNREGTVLYNKDTLIYTSHGIQVEHIALLEEEEKIFLLLDINDEINQNKFDLKVFNESLRMMLHLYPIENQIHLLPKNRRPHSFDNCDFFPYISDFEGNKFIYTEMKKTEVTHYQSIAIGLYDIDQSQPIINLPDIKLRH